MVLSIQIGQKLIVEVTLTNISSDTAGVASVLASILSPSNTELALQVDGTTITAGTLSLNPSETKTIIFSRVIPTTVAIGNYASWVRVYDQSNILLAELIEQNQISVQQPPAPVPFSVEIVSIQEGVM